MKPSASPKLEIEPPTIQPQRSILEPQVVSFPKAKKSGFKNFLFWFFIVEHLVIILLIISLSFFYVKTYAFSDFGELDEKARSYAIQPTNDVSDAVFRRFSAQLPSLPAVEPFDVKADVTEQEASSFMSGIEFSHVSKMYVSFKEQNQILIWVLPEEINQAFMLHLSFEYKNNKVDITTRNAQLGPVPIPVAWVGFLEESLENTVNNYISSAEEQYKITIPNIKTENERVIVDMHFEDPEESVQIFLE